MKVFIKDLETRQGVVAGCSAISEIRIKVFSNGADPDDPAVKMPASIEIACYPDKQKIVEKKARLCSKTIEIADARLVSFYEQWVTDLITYITTNADSPLEGAVVEDTQI
jgi:hypothetical protein